MVAEGRRRIPLRMHLLQEGRYRCVRCAPPRSRQRRVRDVADQCVLEPELLVSLIAGHRFTPDQVASFQRIEQRLQLVVVRTDVRERAVPEDPSDDGGVEEHRPFEGRDRIQPGRDDPADARRQLAPGR